MAKFDKKKFAEQMSKVICDSDLGSDNICSVDMSPTYNAETDEWTLDMMGFEFSEDGGHRRDSAPRRFVPMDTFRLKFSITLIKGEE